MNFHELWSNRVKEQNKTLRSIYRDTSRGYAPKKSAGLRHILSFEPAVLFHPEFKKYFDTQMDAHERRKGMYAFARKHPEYVVAENL